MRVLELYNNSEIILDHEKFVAGLIFMHSSINSHGKLAYDVFEGLEKNGSTDASKNNGEYWKNLVVKQGIYNP